MARALRVTLERDIPGFFPYAHHDGRWVAQEDEELTRIASESGVTPLMEFLSCSVADVKYYMPNEDEQADLGLPDDFELKFPEEHWFAAADGLETVGALLAKLANGPARIDEPENLVSDLEDFRHVLSRAASAGVRWHLSFDM